MAVYFINCINSVNFINCINFINSVNFPIMDNKRSDAVDPRNIPQTPNQENDVKQEGTFRNVKEEGSLATYDDDYEVKKEDEITEEEAATEPEKDN